MIGKEIKLTEDSVVLRTDTPADIGTTIDLEIKLPEGILLKSFKINGTVSGCGYVGDNRSGQYVLEIRIGDISPMNKKILEAYIDFLKREEMLKGIKVEFSILQKSLNDFEKRLRQLRAISELTRTNLRKTLEQIWMNILPVDTTIH